MKSRTTLLRRILLSSALLTGSTTQAIGAPDSPPAKLVSTVKIETVDHETIEGQLLGCSAAAGAFIRVDVGVDRRIPLSDIVRIVTDTPVAPPAQDAARVSLNNGDSILGELGGAGDGSVVVKSADLGDLALPLEWVSRIDLTSSGANGSRTAEIFDHNRGRDDTQTGGADDDAIVLTNGDMLRGFVVGVGSDGVLFDTQSGETEIPLRLVRTAYFAAAEPKPIAPPYLRLTLRQSGQLTVTDIDWSADIARIHLRDKRELTLEADRIVRADVIGGRWEWLSTHKPLRFQHTPMLALDWPFVIDRNVLGKPMAVGETRIETGIGVHSRSSLVYDLRGEYVEFVTDFGIDDDSGSFANVSVFILVDDTRRFGKENIRRGTRHGLVRLDVKKAQRLELIVDFGQNGDLQDRFNWIEPALIRQTRSPGQ
jgi:hypothetical protein